MTRTPSRRQVPSPISVGQVRRKPEAKPGCEEHEPHEGDSSLREEAWYSERECHPEDGAYLRRNQRKVSCLTPGEPLEGNDQGKSAEAIVATQS